MELKGRLGEDSEEEGYVGEGGEKKRWKKKQEMEHGKEDEGREGM